MFDLCPAIPRLKLIFFDEALKVINYQEPTLKSQKKPFSVFSTSLGKNKLHILNDRDLIDKSEIAKLYMKVMTLIFE